MGSKSRRVIQTWPHDCRSTLKPRDDFGTAVAPLLGVHVLGEAAERDLGTPAARQFRYALWNLRPGLQAGSRRAAVTRARDGIAYLWVEVLGHPGRPLASMLGVRPQAGCQAVMQGRQGGVRGSRSCRHNLSYLAGSPVTLGVHAPCRTLCRKWKPFCLR